MTHYSDLGEYLQKLQKNEDCMDYFNDFIAQKLFVNAEYTKELLDQAYEQALKYKNELAVGWCCLYVGWYYNYCGKYDEAIRYHNDANEIFVTHSHTVGLTRTANALLGDYIRIGMFDLAIEHGLNGITIAEQTEDETTLVLLLINTSVAYLDAKYYRECLALLGRLEKGSYQISDSSRLVMYTIFAEAELHFSEIEKALKYCRRAFDLIKIKKLEFFEPEVLYIRARAYHYNGDYDQAEVDFKEGYDRLLNSDNVDIRLKTLISWGKFHLELKKYDSAEDMFLKAVKEAKKIKTPILLKEIYQELSELYSKLEKYKEAYEAIKKSLEYEKEIFNSNSGIWFAKLHSVQITQEASAYKILYDQMNLMSKIGQRITSNLERDITLQTIYQEVNTLVKADVFGIAIYKEEINCLDYEFFAFKGEQVDGGKAPIEGSPSFGAYCFNHKTEIFINDISKEYQKYLNITLPIDDDNPNKPNSLIFCPLIIENRTIGIISVQQFNKHAYTKNDLNILRMLTSYIAIALENTKLFHEVEYLATYDSLSGALNRREVLKLGQTYFEQNIDNEDEMSIIMLDIDYFKNINDTYGHFVGDDVIKQVATLIQSNVREYDFVGRYGGEEFLIVLLKTDLQCAKVVAERIRKAVEETNYGSTNQINVTVSSGLYQLTYEELNFFEGVKLADIALYKAKQLGRNKVVNYISDLSLSINK